MQQRWKTTTALTGLALGALWLAPRLFPAALDVTVVPTPPEPPPAESPVPARRVPLSLDLVLEPHAVATAVRGPVDVAVVLDTSGSMRDGRLDAAKEALLHLAARLGPSDTLTVVTFDDRARIVHPAAPVDAVRLDRTLDRVWDHGGTDLHSGIALALDALPERTGASRQLLLLSDGEPTVGHKQPAAFEALGARAAQQRVTVNAIGLGDAVDDALLDEVASLSGGRVLRTDHEDRLDELFTTVWTSFRAPSVLGSSLAIRFPPGTRLLEPHGAPERDWTLVPVGAFEPGAPRRVDLVVEVAAGHAVPDALDVELRYRDARGSHRAPAQRVRWSAGGPPVSVHVQPAPSPNLHHR